MPLLRQQVSASTLSNYNLHFACSFVHTHPVTHPFTHSLSLLLFLPQTSALQRIQGDVHANRIQVGSSVNAAVVQARALQHPRPQLRGVPGLHHGRPVHHQRRQVLRPCGLHLDRACDWLSDACELRDNRNHHHHHHHHHNHQRCALHWHPGVCRSLWLHAGARDHPALGEEGAVWPSDGGLLQLPALRRERFADYITQVLPAS